MVRIMVSPYVEGKLATYPDYSLVDHRNWEIAEISVEVHSIRHALLAAVKDDTPAQLRLRQSARVGAFSEDGCLRTQILR
jgi:hypothetical protein